MDKMQCGRKYSLKAKGLYYFFEEMNCSRKDCRAKIFVSVMLLLE